MASQTAAMKTSSENTNPTTKTPVQKLVCFLGLSKDNRDPKQDANAVNTPSYVQEERNEIHPECVNCHEILKKPPPCTCDLCRALNHGPKDEEPAKVDPKN